MTGSVAFFSTSPSPSAVRAGNCWRPWRPCCRRVTVDVARISGLRARLIEMRSDLVAQLAAESVEPGFLHILASVGAVNSLTIGAGAADGAVVSDDSAAIRLALYEETGAVAAVVVRLAGELVLY
jgi:hypothetical protein